MLLLVIIILCIYLIVLLRFNLVVEVRYCFSLAPILDFDSAFFASASFNSCCNFLAGIQIGLFLL
jgi:hypothetical protein